jgi:UDPglucose 6-dehydrogenase
MNIAVVGTGYVGLVTGACFASSGNNVICVDIDKNKIDSLKKGIVPFFEPGLEDIVKTNIKEKRLSFTTDIKNAIENSSIIFIAVGTPQSEDGAADISYVLNVAKSIGEYINDYKIIVTKSTVPVGTTEKVRDSIKSCSDIKFDIASNPEFLKEGAAVEDFLKPERVVIGIENPEPGEILKELYSPFMRSQDRAITVSIRSSELSKYASNAMLATRISFMNEVAKLCELVGADVSDVRSVMGSDKRIGRHYLYPGLGYGGSCFPKDVRALVNTAKENNYELKICASVDQVNYDQRVHFFGKIQQFFNGNLEGKNFGIWGLSFKPNTDDIREAPSLFLIDEILEHGASLTVHDPSSMQQVKDIYGDRIEYAKSNYKVCENKDALIICTEWSEYRQPDFQRISKLMNSQVIFDGRNLYNRNMLEKKGFKYFAFGI